MKKILLAFFIASFSLFISQCSEFPTHEKKTSNQSQSIKVAIAVPPGFDTIALNAYVQISGESMDTIINELSINKNFISGVVHNVPAGYKLHFEVFINGYDNMALYYGDTYADIYTGLETYVSIVLRKAGGTAIISGYIEEYNPPSDTIPAPQTPYISSYELNNAIPPKCRTLGFETNGSFYPDSLYYIWDITRIYGTDTFKIHKMTGMAYSLDYPKDGDYYVQVMAQSMYDTTKYSLSSYYLTFEIRNGLLADTIPVPSDKIPPVITLNGPDSITISQGTIYHDAGASAYDNVDGDLTYNIKIYGFVNTNVPGYYYLEYVVYDKSGNKSTAIRLIIVTATSGKDFTPPVITLEGPATITLGLNEPFIEPGYSAYDNVDGDITSKVTVDIMPDSEGVTFVLYNVSDLAGNSAYATRYLVRELFPIPTPARPRIVSKKILDSSPVTIQISFQTSSVRPANGNRVSYEWMVLPEGDSAYTIETSNTKMTCIFPDNNYYSVKVHALGMQDTSLISDYSVESKFRILNGKVEQPVQTHY